MVTPLLTRPIYNKTHMNKNSPSLPLMGRRGQRGEEEEAFV